MGCGVVQNTYHVDDRQEEIYDEKTLISAIKSGISTADTDSGGCETPGQLTDSSDSGESVASQCPLSVKKISLDTPPMEEIRAALEVGLASYFCDVEVKIVQCPDLTVYGLASAGLCGNATLVDVGHVRNLLEPYRHATTYNLPEVLDALQLPFSNDCLIAGAGHATCVSGACAGRPGELVLNEVRDKRNKRNKFCSAYSESQPCLVRRSSTFTSDKSPDNSSVFKVGLNAEGEVGLFAQALVSRGEPGLVLEVSCRQRITEDNFPNAMRHSLATLGRIGLGGMFTVSGANSKISTLHSLPSTEIQDVEELFQQSVKFGELVGDARCFTTLISSDEVRSYGHEHTHCEGVSSSLGGHWWEDLDASAVSYHGFFVPADSAVFVEHEIPKEHEHRTVADEVVEGLAGSGVKVVFGGHGAAISPVIEAVGRHPDTQWVYTRHEGNSSLMAAALSKFTSSTQICIATCGPGALNLTTGLADAQHDQLSVLAITGTLPQDSRGFGDFQDIDQAAVFKQLVPTSLDVTSANRAVPLVQRCFQQAQTNSQVAHISIPVNIQKEGIEPPLPPPPSPVARTTSRMSRASMTSSASRTAFMHNNMGLASSSNQHAHQEAASFLLTALRPVLVLGRQALGCHETLEQFLGAYAMPVLCSVDGKGCIDDGHPLMVGSWGIFGHPAIHESHTVLLSSDLVISIGCSEFSGLLVHHDVQVRTGILVETIASSQACSTALAWDHAVLGDISENLQGIIQQLKGKETPRTSWHFEASKPVPLPARVCYESPAEFCHPKAFFSSFNRVFVSPNAVVSVDVGDVTVWTARCLHLMPGARLLSSQRLGTMGYGLCGAIAVKLHSPDMRCAAICGDGGFAMSLAELAVASQHKLGILVVIFNNEKMARVVFGSTQDVENAGTDLVNPDFLELAKAYGGHGIRIDGGSDIDGCLNEAMNYMENGTFVILDVRVDPELRAPFCAAGEMEAAALIENR